MGETVILFLMHSEIEILNENFSSVPHMQSVFLISICLVHFSVLRLGEGGERENFEGERAHPNAHKGFEDYDP